MTTDDAAADRSAVGRSSSRPTQWRSAQTALNTATALGPWESSAQHDNVTAQFANLDSRIRQLVAEAIEFKVGTDDLRAATSLSSTELAAALRRAEAAHGEHEKRIGQRDADWPNWYAEYIVREQAGKELPT